MPSDYFDTDNQTGAIRHYFIFIVVIVSIFLNILICIMGVN